MRLYVMWNENDTEAVIMDITKMVEDVMIEQPQLDKVIIANAIMDLAEADCVMTANSEEDMLKLFPNAKVKYERDFDGEVFH